jgi:cellulose synthase/poly-beta-1,6-N-acetylglucosamine synthase-like glycosyltransferase
MRVIVIAYLLTAVAVLLLVPCLVLLVQAFAALQSTKKSEALVTSTEVVVPNDVCILMPAHNEAAGIVPVLQALLPQLDGHIRLLVVADNCTDSTAAVVRETARLAGCKVEIVERFNAELRGKGYALHYGVQHLKNTPPDVVLVLDADCTIQPGGITVLATACMTTQRPHQALYLMQSQLGKSVKTQLAEFAWVVKNQVRPLGFDRLGLPCQLMGTGMAFTWDQISTANLNTGHIAEDMQLGVELARAGTPPKFCPEALVTSFFPTGAEGLQTQRTRWEHGHLSVIVAEVPRLLYQAITTVNGQLFAMVLDLCVPPLALLTLMVVSVMVVSCAVLIGTSLTSALLPFALSSLAVGFLAFAVLLAWWRFGRGVISLKQLCSVPAYVMAKVSLYFYFLVKRQASWVRSKREGE